jgi:hypothetical protein
MILQFWATGNDVSLSCVGIATFRFMTLLDITLAQNLLENLIVLTLLKELPALNYCLLQKILPLIACVSSSP